MKKFLALAMAACMALSMVACGGSASSAASQEASSGEAASSATTAEAAGGLTKVALVCDTGTIDDESFNQACWTAVEAYKSANGIEDQYYLPPSQDASDEDRETMIRTAVNDGADTVVCVGYLYGASLLWASEQYPDIRFIAIDVTQYDITGDSGDPIPSNIYCITFKEEQAGYLAGYAVGMDGWTNVGFLGGMAVPAVIRYGYGYLQGLDAAAQETGNSVTVNYYYGGQFYGDANITSRMEGWYGNGTELVFACGGGIYTSAVEAALKSNGYVVGVDVDQNYIGVNGVADGSYDYNPFVTSAMKGLSASVNSALTSIANGEWASIAGTNANLGLEEGDFVGLPTADDSWNFRSFTQEQYEAVVAKIASGEITVDNACEDAVKPELSDKVNVTYIA